MTCTADEIQKAIDSQYTSLNADRKVEIGV